MLVQIYFSKFVPIVASETVDSTNSVFGCRKKVQDLYVVTFDAIG